MKKIYQDRFLNNKILRVLARPQYPDSGSITSLTAVINYLFSEDIGIQTPDEIAKILKFTSAGDLKINPDVSNETIMKWFRLVLTHYNLKGSCRVAVGLNEIKNFDDSLLSFDYMKNQIPREDRIYVYHLENHFNLVAGYFESAHYDQPDKVYSELDNLSKWILLGEHTTNKNLEFILKLLKNIPLNFQMKLYIEDKLNPSPIWCRRWKNIRKDFLYSQNHCFIQFEKEIKLKEE